VKLRVRFAETDQMGVAHHGSYAIWLEAARIEWLRERGISYREIEAGGTSLAVSRLRINYHRSALFDDVLEITARLVEAKSRRFRYTYRITREGDGALIAIGESVHTPTDRSGRAVRLGEPWLSRLQKYREDSVTHRTPGGS
jgi:acyl-CoA thioester hydrolase